MIKLILFILHSFFNKKKKSKKQQNAARRPLPFIAMGMRMARKNSSAARPSTARNYITALHSLAAFCGRDPDVREISPMLMADYADWLLQNGVCLNTSSCYMRSLRAIYNKVTASYRLRNRRPFDRVFTGNAPTVKRSITASQIRRLQSLPLPPGHPLRMPLDVFLFCLYAQGMPFADVARLSRRNVRGDSLCYRRRKTGRSVRIRIEPCMREIINRYARPDSDLLFPTLLRGGGGNSGSGGEYQRALHRHNNALRRIAAMAGLRGGITSYVARHTWATMAFSEGIPLNIISQAMGHSTPRTTMIYVADVGGRALSSANRKILKRLKAQ